MPNTQNSFEYHILRYLNRPEVNERYDLELSDLKAALPEFTLAEFEAEFPRLERLKFIGTKDHKKNKDQASLGITITDQGKIRLNQMQNHIDTLRNLAAIQSTTDKTKDKVDLIARWGLILAVISVLVGIVQTIYTILQYHGI
ncbi:MAG: hypothetical protein L6Q81_07515 [Bacteroidia bacterium]|nr:hypothetical protein [Bacteroidia bacterium]